MPGYRCHASRIGTANQSRAEGFYRSDDQLADLPRFTGGAVGFFGYDLLQYYEKLPAHRIDDLQMNDIQFMFCDQVIVFDHFKQQIKVIANVHVPQFATDADIAKAYQATCEKIDATIEKIKRPLKFGYDDAQSDCV